MIRYSIRPAWLELLVLLALLAGCLLARGCGHAAMVQPADLPTIRPDHRPLERSAIATSQPQSEPLHQGV
jgi:hypothetical protein